MCKKWYNETVRSVWNEGPNSDEAQQAQQQAQQQQAEQQAAAAAAAAQARAQQEAQDRLLAEARENDRRRGRRATVISGVVGDPNFGKNVTAKSPYSLGGGATRLGG